MKIISNEEYNKLKETQRAYLDLLMKPLQGVFEKVTDDDLLRENGLLNAENERLNNIINELEKELKKDMEVYICGGRSNGKTFRFVEKIVKAYYLDKLKKLKEGSEDNENN